MGAALGRALRVETCALREGDSMATILRRLLVEDVEETKRHLAATAADRRRRGVAGEAYFTSPERPNQLIVVFDGENIAQLHVAIHPVNPDRGSELPAPT